MTTQNYYYRSANSAATLPYGTVTAGGGAGSEASPYADFSGVEALVESAAASATDLVLHFHPAFCVGGTANTFDQWNNVGRIGGGWTNVTLKRWDAILDTEPLYANWYPTLDTHQYLVNGDWTQGSISAGVWSAGSGDVYRTSATLNISANSPTRLRCWGGHQFGDNLATYIIAGCYCAGLSDVTEEGDYCMTGGAGAFYLYFKTGTVGSSPSAKYGYFGYATWSNAGNTSILAYNPQNLTFQDMQTIGGPIRVSTLADGDMIDNITFTRPRARMMNGGNGIECRTVDGYRNSRCRNIVVRDPNMNAGASLNLVKGASSSLPASNGLEFSGSTDGLWVYNPIIEGWSHAQIQCQGDDDTGSPLHDTYPRNCHIIIDDISDGKGIITGMNGYSRGLNWVIPGGSTIGPLRISGQRTLSQVGGVLELRGTYWDDTCIAFSDPLGSDNYNVGNHVSIVARLVDGHDLDPSVQHVRFCGTKHDLVGGVALYWDVLSAVDSVEFNSCLVRDDGHTRLRVSGDSGNYFYTRRRCPITAAAQSAAGQSEYQKLINSYFIFSNTEDTVEGMVATHISGPTTAANATAVSWPVNQYDEAASGEDPAINYTTARIFGNQEVVGATSGLDFDSSLEYTGTRRTAIQTPSIRGRGYK